MQGTVWGSLFCTVLMDKLAKHVYENPELIYMYKDVVATPTLGMVDDILGVSKCDKEKATNINTTVNTFVELNKMKLSTIKCHNIHIGKTVKGHECTQLNAHGEPIKSSHEEKYLGDTICSGMTGNKTNIDKRKAKGLGIVANILALLEEIPFGKYKLKAGLMLREAWLINGTLYNSEAWHAVTDKQIVSLEKLDETLLRGLLGGISAKCPLEFLYLETGAIPIRYIISTRRILYMKKIKDRPNEELIKRVYEAQELNPSKGDLCELVKKDMHKFNIHMTKENIQQLNYVEFKTIVKNKVKYSAFSNLKMLQNNHSKVKSLIYRKHEQQKYMSSQLFNSKEVELLASLRSNCVRGIKDNFKGSYNEYNCKLKCNNTRDTQKHILECRAILIHVNQDRVPIYQVKYEDIYSSSIYVQKSVTNVYDLLLTIRDKLLNEESITAEYSADPCTSPVQM
jgi:hypothetical protein